LSLHLKIFPESGSNYRKLANRPTLIATTLGDQMKYVAIPVINTIHHSANSTRIHSFQRVERHDCGRISDAATSAIYRPNNSAREPKTPRAVAIA
jgi:hypothetical protein